MLFAAFVPLKVLARLTGMVHWHVTSQININFIKLLQDTAIAKRAAAEVSTPQPCVVVVKDAFLVIEKQIVCRIPDLTDLPAVLLAAFYTFNLHYTEGCSNLYSFFEVTLLGKKIGGRKTRLAGVLANLSN